MKLSQLFEDPSAERNKDLQDENKKLHKAANEEKKSTALKAAEAKLADVKKSHRKGETGEKVYTDMLQKVYKMRKAEGIPVNEDADDRLADFEFAGLGKPAEKRHPSEIDSATQKETNSPLSRLNKRIANARKNGGDLKKLIAERDALIKQAKKRK